MQLTDTAESQPWRTWPAQVLVLELLDGDREGCREEHDLAVLRQQRDERLDGRLELGREQLVSLQPVAQGTIT